MSNKVWILVNVVGANGGVLGVYATLEECQGAGNRELLKHQRVAAGRTDTGLRAVGWDVTEGRQIGQLQLNAIAAAPGVYIDPPPAPGTRQVFWIPEVAACSGVDA